MAIPHSHLSHPKYRPDIDGLRAVAVLSVVAFHAFPNWIKGGFVGVDVFFVISGYLISTIIFENFDKGTFSFSEFYARRIRRIFPALLLVLTSSFAFGWFFLFADEYKQLGKHIAAGAGFVSNIVFLNEAGYFDNLAETKPLLHLWSLGVEEQFYIVWPFLLWLAWKCNFNLLLITIIITIVSFILNINGVKEDAVATFYLPQTRFWELLSGSLLAWITLYKKGEYTAVRGKLATTMHQEAQMSDVKILSNVISFLGLCLLIYGFLRINKEFSFPGKWAIIPVLGAILLISAGTKAWINRTILSNKIFVWFGLISFPLYLWHWPLLSFARLIESGVPSPNIRIAVVILSIMLAWITYRLVERPLRLGRHNRAKVLILIFFMVIVGFVGYNTYKRDGLKFRSFIKSTDAGLAFEWPATKNQNTNCLEAVDLNYMPYCLISSNSNVTVALIGDSHANAIYDFVENYFSKKNTGVIMLGQGGCPPFLGVERDANSCPNVMNNIVDYVINNQNIKDVYITGRFAATQSGVNFGDKTPNNFYALKIVGNPLIIDRSEIFKIGLGSMLKRLNEYNKNVTIVLDLPELNFEPKSCLWVRGHNKCILSKDIVFARQAAYRNVIDALSKHYKFNIIDLADAFCDEKICFAKYDGKILYRDSHHLGIYGNEYLIRKGFVLD